MANMPVVLRNSARREANIGWHWLIDTGERRVEILVPDEVLRSLEDEGISPFSSGRSAAGIFFDRLEAAAARRKPAISGENGQFTLRLDDFSA